MDDAPSSSAHDGLFVLVILGQRETKGWLYWDREEQQAGNTGTERNIKAGYTGTEQKNGLVILGQRVCTDWLHWDRI